METWKDIQGYEGLYKVSSIGRIMSNHTNKKGEGWQILSGYTDTKGYQRIGLYKNGLTINQKIHRLVARAFIPNPDNKAEVNHKDSNKQNNNAENLEWVTLVENMKHAYDNKLIPAMIGSKNGRSKITEADVIIIRSMAYTGIDYKDIKKHFPVNEKTIHKIIHRKLWDHVK